jgi:hypothetical protein
MLLHHIMRLARTAGATLWSDFVHTGRNRMMYLTYKMAGFKDVRSDGPVLVLQDSGTVPAAIPAYVDVTADSL